MPSEETESLNKIDLKELKYQANPLSDHLICPICQNILNNPVTTICGHIFCRECIEESLRLNNVCPLDRTRLNIDNERDISPCPLIIKNLIDDLNVFCLNTEKGCNWIGKRWDAENHISSICTYTSVTCGGVKEDGDICNELIERRFVFQGEDEDVQESDAEKKCHHMKYKCEFCDSLIDDITKSDHHDEKCEFNIVLCENCRSQIPKKYMTEHLLNCEEVTMKCSASSIGCPVISKKEKVVEHESSCIFIKLLPNFVKFNDKINQLENEKLESQRKVKRLNSIIQDNKDIQKMNRQIKELNNQIITLNFESERTKLEIENKMSKDRFEMSSSINVLNFLTSENLKVNNELMVHKNMIANLRKKLQFLMVSKNLGTEMINEEIEKKINLKL